MKTYKHKTNGSTMTYKDGYLKIDNLVIEGTPNLDYWEETIDHSIMLECIKRFPKGSKVKDYKGNTYRVATKPWTAYPEKDDWLEGIYYYGSDGNVLAIKENRANGFYLYKDGEFAEKVEDKEYEILSFYDNGTILRVVSKKPFTGELLETSLQNYPIHSVKRLSDGEVFSLGDSAQTKGKYPHKITAFKIRQKQIDRENYDGVDRIWVCWEENSGGNWLENIEQVRTHLFKTEDGKDIFEGDTYVVVDERKYNKLIVAEGQVYPDFRTTIEEGEVKVFSSKEKADEYVFLNSPCLSYNDIEEMLPTFKSWDEGMKKRKLKELIKQKLCK